MARKATLSFIGLMCLCMLSPFNLCLAKVTEGIKLKPENQHSSDEQQQFLASAQHYLQLSENANTPQSNEYRLMAADMYAQAGQSEEAKNIVEKVPETNNNPNLATLKQIVLAEVAINDENPQLAQAHLKRLQNRDGLSRSQRSRMLYLQAKTYESTRQYYLAARARALLDSLLPDYQSQMMNRRQIMMHLSKLPPEKLSRAARSEPPAFSGWLSLAFIKKNNNPRTYNMLIQDWLRDYPNHPGNAMISQGRHMYSGGGGGRYHRSNIRHVALLLPLSGQHAKAAKAIREGFLAAYYENSQKGGNKPTIKVYDSSSDVVRVYDRAVREGADFVVGPLTKNEVLRLSQMSYSIRTPILALNEHPAVNPHMRSFVQFSLAPEEEADQIIEKARELGFRHASIVVPKNNWGNRLESRFHKKWGQAGGEVVSRTKVDPNKDLSAQIRQLLAIDESQSRCSAIKRQIKEKVEYKLRRRDDIDVIFMALPPDQARQIKPLFDFYYANDIPVLATSSIYSGQPNPKNDRDMNGVQFVDMPWLVDPQKNNQLNDMITRYHGNEMGESSRLFAMGVDAYKLTISFNQLQKSRNSAIQGATGKLSLGSDNRIDRKMSWAKISNGTPTILQ